MCINHEKNNKIWWLMSWIENDFFNSIFGICVI